MTLYLLHSTKALTRTNPATQEPITVQHYLGWTPSEESLDTRIREHRNGLGSRICRAFREIGGTLLLAEVLPGDRARERQLKRISRFDEMCPVCQANKLAS